MQVLDIAMFVPGIPFDGSSFERGSLGGSESAALYMAKALATLGHRVKVFSNTREISSDREGASYYPLGMWNNYARNTPHDVTIVQRAPEAFANTYAGKLNILWQHDLMMGRQSGVLRQTMWNIDRIFVLSEFMRKQYRDISGLPDEVFYTTRNGIDSSLFSRDAAKVHNRKHLVYSSRPERGLDILIEKIFPRILSKDPEYTLHLCGYHNPVPHLEPFYNHVNQLAAAFGDKVKNHGALTKEKLAQLFCNVGMLVYPTPGAISPQFREVSCITAMEAQAAGIPMITSANGALTETLPTSAGFHVEGDPWSETYQENFANAVLLLGDNPEMWQKMHEAGRARKDELSWLNVALDWSEQFEKLIREHSSNRESVIRHFWRQSDIIAAREMVEEMDAGEQRADLVKLLSPFDFAFKGPDGFREQYAKIGQTHTDVFEVIQREPRFAHMRDWLQAHDEIQTVLDYGCGLGGYAGHGARQTGKTFTGVDIDPRTIEMATESTKNIPNVSFMVGEYQNLPMPDESYDCVMAQEVLEHVSYPWEVVQAIEAKAKKGGWVYLSVPFGPWEYSSYHTYPHRCHIWHFDSHDLHDMFGSKEALNIAPMYHIDSDELGNPMGWWLITFKADHKPIPKIDMERKKWLVRPRQTVSATLIVGGEQAEETLAMTLKSIQHVADEIIMVNCGMGPIAHYLATQYNARVVEGVDPKTHGFEVARNLGVKAARMDFVFWIDSDERLIQPRQIHKYLRQSMFTGFGIRQHHFAVDTSFTPDMPVRLFRNGKGMRFFGAIHEHPELELNKGPGAVVVLSDVHIAHIGYLNEDIRQRRFIRNFPLLKLDMERYPDRLLQKHFLMRDGMILVREALKQNGGRVDSGIQAKCREVVDIYRKYFQDKVDYANSDSLQYYSEALTVLGEGFEASFSIGAAKENVPPAPQARYRFANTEDFVKEVSKRAKESAAHFDNPMY